MTFSSHWRTGYIDLFLEQDDRHEYIPHVGIEGIKWGESGNDVCVYCGVEFEGDMCPGCGDSVARTEYSLGCAHVTLLGILPLAGRIFSLPDGSVIEALNGRRGPRDRWHPNMVILRFSNCHIVERQIPSLVNFFPGEDEFCMLRVKLRCEVELYPENG